MPSEQSLIPYHPTELLPQLKILVFAPHPDDEIFGCGGVLALHRRTGCDIDVVILTSGDLAGVPSAREQESIAAAEVLGLKPPEFWRLQDRSLVYGEPLVCRCADTIRCAAPDLVYAPSLWEIHPDHRAVALSVIEGFQRSGCQGSIVFFEVSAALRPNRLVDISSVANLKQSAMRQFASQNIQHGYPDLMLGLNRFRTYTLGPDVLAAEAFEVISAADLSRGALPYYQSQYSRELSTGTAIEVDAPLVSVLIRSMDRPQLVDAMQSVAMQTWPRIEMVVVDATGGKHRPLANHYGPFPVRFIAGNTPLTRSQAANVALGHAGGEFACFLDDDDWIAPGHIAGLVGTLRQHPSLIAAYSAALVVLSDGLVVDRYAEPYDPELLHARNYLPIHSVVFRLGALGSSHFDESLEVFEDWDFWLQLSASGPFRLLAQDTAFYRADYGSSSIGVYKDEGIERTARLNIFRKWFSWWSDEKLERLGRRLISLANANDRLNVNQVSLEKLAAERATQTETIKQLNADLGSLKAEYRRTQDETALRDRHIATCEARIRNQDADAALRDDYIEEQRQHIVHLETNVRAAWKEVERLNAEVSRLSQEEKSAREILEARISHLHEKIQDIYRSSSWRVTAPLRYLRRLLKPISRTIDRANPIYPDRVELPEFSELPKATPWIPPVIDQGLHTHPVIEPFVSTKAFTSAIVIPIYNGYEYLDSLFASLVSSLSAAKNCCVFIIDDASSDTRIGTGLAGWIQGLPEAVVLTNDRNRGFVHSANRGLKAALSKFVDVEHFPVVILNSDTELPKHWLERLCQPILDQPESVASVTPFTNAGTICSFPRFIEDNPMPEGATLASLDAACSHLSPFSIEIPTGVGFCMAMNSAALRRIGLFNEELFGRGYAEENDWCRRAASSGYSNLLQPGLFVWHKHGGSFPSEEKQQLIECNLKRLTEQHPDYHHVIQMHIEADPAAPLRASVALAWLLERGQVALVIDHNMGGGANDYRRQLTERLLQTHVGVLIYLEDFIKTPPTLEIRVWDTVFKLPLDSRKNLLDLLPAGAIKSIFYNEGVSQAIPEEIPEQLTKLVELHGAELTVAIHDYYPLCPSYTLLDDKQHFCGVPDDLEICRKCLPRNGFMLSSTKPFTNINCWRQSWKKTLSIAHKILCFSESSAALVRRAYPASAEISTKIEVLPHEVATLASRIPTIRFDQPLVLGAIGAIGMQKGSRIIRRMAKIIENKNLPIRIAVIGNTDVQDMPGCVTVSGTYVPAELPDLIEKFSVNMGLMASIWPETFSYVTAEMMSMNLPILAFNIGAPAERLATYPLGRLVESVTAEAMLEAAISWHNELRGLND